MSDKWILKSTDYINTLVVDHAGIAVPDKYTDLDSDGFYHYVGGYRALRAIAAWYRRHWIACNGYNPIYTERLYADGRLARDLMHCDRLQSITYKIIAHFGMAERVLMVLERASDDRPARDRTIWIVNEGLQGGYLPNVSSAFETKAAALDYMRDRAASAREDGYTVTGSARAGWYSLNDNESIELDSMLASVAIADFAAVGIDAAGWDFAYLVERLNDNGM